MKKIFYLIATLTTLVTSSPLTPMINNNDEELTKIEQSKTLYDEISELLTLKNQAKIADFNSKTRFLVFSFDEENCSASLNAINRNEALTNLSEKNLSSIKNGNYEDMPAYILNIENLHFNIPRTIIINIKGEKFANDFKQQEATSYRVALFYAIIQKARGVE